ncbi:MAG: hypothetical protein LBD68_10590 [Zoogloeaceae bacterium]|jgi:hypothetical protein|nr:hypothetical protein [Zoogloeaceae bacterium]
MTYWKVKDKDGNVIEWQDTARFSYAPMQAGQTASNVEEAEYFAANPGEAARIVATREAEALRQLAEIDRKSIRAMREAALGGGNERLSALESDAQTLRQTLTNITASINAGGGSGGGVSIKVNK